MYYKELKRRNPLFLGASKKGVGFGSPQLINERTCLAQYIADINIEAAQTEKSQYHRRVKTSGPSKRDVCNKCFDETFIKVSPIQFAKRNDGKQRKTSQLKGEQGAQTSKENLNPDSQHSLDKAIEMQSFGAMSGVDGFAVKEIEQLMHAGSATNSDLRDVAFLPYSVKSNKACLSGDERDGQRSEHKKSKVIFSVKKEQPSIPNIQSAYKIQDKDYGGETILKSTVKSFSGSNAASSNSLEIRSSSVRSQPVVHEQLNPLSKRFSQGKTKLPDQKPQPQNDQSKLWVNHLSTFHAQEHKGQDRKRFELQYRSQINSIEQTSNSQINTPQQVHSQEEEGVLTAEQKRLQNIHSLSKIKIKVRDNVENHDRLMLPETFNSELCKNENFNHPNDFPLKSFTCVDIEHNNLKGRNQRSSITSNGLQRQSSNPEISSNKTSNIAALVSDQIRLVIRSNSNLAQKKRLQDSKDKIALPDTAEWVDICHDDTAEFGSPKNRDQEIAKKKKHARVLSPKILNIELSNSLGMYSKYLNQFKNSLLRNSTKNSASRPKKKSNVFSETTQKNMIKEVKQLENRQQATTQFNGRSKLQQSPTNFGNKNSSNSFRISEGDSQRTLSPLSCKEETLQSNLQHSQGYIMHRGNKLYQMQRLRYKTQHRRIKSNSRLSNLSQDQKFHRAAKKHRNDCVMMNLNQPEKFASCTCNLNLDQTQKLHHLVIEKKKSSPRNSSDRKNRIVLVVRNEDKQKILALDQTLPKNPDLPIGDEKMEPGKKSIGKVVQTVFHVGKRNVESNTIVPISINGNEQEDQDKELKKSGSNMDQFIQAKQSMQRLIQSSTSQGEAHESRNQIIRQDVSEAKMLTPYSSTHMTHIMSAVNQQSDTNVMVNASYPQIIQLKEKEKKKSSLNIIRVKKDKPKVQLKLRQGKNPNQWPPRFIRRKRSSVRPCQSSRVEEQGGFISIKVKDDQKIELSSQKRKSLQKDELHNFNSLKPYSILASEQLSETILSFVASGAEKIPHKQLAYDSGPKLDKQVNTKEAFQYSAAKITCKQRPQSQYAVGSTRMNRLQRFFQTQRGKNIMSIVSKNTGGASQSGATAKSTNQTTINQTKPEILDTIVNETSNKLNLDALSSAAALSKKTIEKLNLIGKTAIMRNLSELPIFARQLRNKSATYSNKVDVGQSIQRFSIHLSPRNQTIQFMLQDQEKECPFHKKMLLQQDSVLDSHAFHDRGVSQFNFLPTLPENQKGKYAINTKLPSKRNSSSDQEKDYLHENIAKRQNNSRDQMKHINLTCSPTGMPSSPDNKSTAQVLVNDYTSRPKIQKKDSSYTHTRTGGNFSANSAASSTAVDLGKSVQQKIVRGLAQRHFASNVQKSEAQVGTKNKPVKVDHLKQLQTS